MIGGNRSTVGSIRAMRRAGFQVVVADKLPRQSALAEGDIGLEIAPADVEGLDRAIRSLDGVDGIIGINEVAMLSAAELQKRFGYIGLPAEVIIRTTSKLAQRRSWNVDENLFVACEIVADEDSMEIAVDRVGGLPVVVKPDMSHGGSRGVTLVEEPAELRAAFAFAKEHALSGSQVLVERALQGSQFSAELLVKDGRTSVLAIGRKVKSEPPYRVDLAISYPGMSDEASIDAVQRLSQRAAELLGISSGPGHFEFALTESGLRPIELAARCGGSITPDLASHVSGYHPMVEAARQACGIGGNDLPTPARRGAVLMFVAFAPCVVRKLHFEEVLAEWSAVIDSDCWLPPDGVIQPIRWTAQRTGYLGVVADDGPRALAIAQEIAERIFVETEGGGILWPLTFAASHEIAS